jgi:hypothetical protein
MGMTSGLNSWGISFVGGGYEPQGLSYKVFNLTSHPAQLSAEPLVPINVNRS